MGSLFRRRSCSRDRQDRRVGPFSWTTACWTPRLKPKASCPGKGANTAIPWSSSNTFPLLTFQLATRTQISRKSCLILSVRINHTHVPCKGVACLILVFFHCGSVSVCLTILFGVCDVCLQCVSVSVCKVCVCVSMGKGSRVCLCARGHPRS